MSAPHQQQHHHYKLATSASSPTPAPTPVDSVDSGRASLPAAGDIVSNLKAARGLIVSHPLFPLVSMTLQKCELSTTSSSSSGSRSSTAGTPDSQNSLAAGALGFDDDVAQFANEMVSAGIEPFTGNREVDSIMVQSIQVLRFHLLELEKVHELCDNFCSRYIACLKGKMPAELQVVDERQQEQQQQQQQQQLYLPLDNKLTDPKPDPISDAEAEIHMQCHCKHNCDTQVQPTAEQTVQDQDQHFRHSQLYNQYSQYGLLQHQQHLHQQAYHSQVPPLPTAVQQRQQYHPGLSPVSPIDLAAHPVPEVVKVTSSPGGSVDSTPRLVIVTGSPSPEHSSDSRDRNFPELSAEGKRLNLPRIEYVTAAAAAPTVANSKESSAILHRRRSQKLGLEPLQHSEQQEPLRQRKRGIFPKCATNAMRNWLFRNLNHPYPSEEQKKQLSADTGLTILQVNNWFINARRRIVQPIIEQPNRDGLNALDSEAAALATYASFIDERRQHLMQENSISGSDIEQTQEQPRQQQQQHPLQSRQQTLPSLEYQQHPEYPQYQHHHDQSQRHQMMLMSAAHYMYTTASVGESGQQQPQQQQHQHPPMQHIPVPNNACVVKPEC